VNRAKKDHYMEAMDAVGAAVPHTDFSIWGLFWAADWIVKSVMLGLLGASIWCWAIIIDKTIIYRRTNAEMNRFERTFWSGQSLEELYQMQSEKPSGGMGAVFVAAMKEWKRSHEQNAASFVGMQQRLDKVLDVAIARESENLEKRLGFLATIGSAGPFIGLFGTVWGIMNAFTAIAASSSTNLAVVAGPIAEALFATAIGLVAAIPAVIAYNKLSSDSSKMVGRLEGFADEFSTILSRQLEARSH
jgi:biopolymer transport protein TolQ|tara:strand:- start:623 stop:1360 length:738 start_codon:yes stop_codon:yes gene_type:complete